MVMNRGYGIGNNATSPNTFTDVDIIGMRLLDILINRKVELYPQSPGNILAAQLDGFASSPKLERKLIAHPPFHASMRSRQVIAARNRFIAAWKKGKRQTSIPFEPTVSRFSFLLFVDPSLALRELQALHVYDALAKRFAHIRKVTAMDVNRTLVVLNLLRRADAASGIDNFVGGINHQPIYDAFDMVQDPNHSWAPAACASSFHLTEFTASMVQGAFAMLPTL
jgi:hypothetical protein